MIYNCRLDIFKMTVCMNSLPQSRISCIVFNNYIFFTTEPKLSSASNYTFLRLWYYLGHLISQTIYSIKCKFSWLYCLA